MIALVILVFLDAQDAGTQLPEALAHAAEQALGAGTTVTVRPVTAGIDERQMNDAARAAGAAAIARLSWTDEQRLQGTVALHVLAGDRRATGTLVFKPTDPLPERGRALGLVLAALLAPESGRNDDARGSPAAAPAPLASSTAPAKPDATAVTRTEERPLALSGRGWFLDAAAEGGVAIGGAGSGMGGTLGFGRGMGERLGWRLGARARFGEIGDAQASVLSAGLSLGLLMTARRAEGRERIELDLRLDALLLYETLSHFSDDDTERVRRGRFLPGAALSAEGRLLLGPGAALVLGAGPEVAFGKTDVIVHQVEVAELVPVRVSVHGGLRMTF